MNRILLVALMGIMTAGLLPGTVNAQSAIFTFNVWPGEPPVKVPVDGPEAILLDRPRPFYQITNVSEPTVAVHLPERFTTGAAVLVCPGGGLRRLAIEHEGREVARWLNSLGVAAFVLKYRVPAPVEIGVQDAQRALSVIRSGAEGWGLDAESMGMVGFSAGGEIGAWMSTHERQYAPIDIHDQASCRPAFAALIYPGGLVSFPSRELKEAIMGRIGTDTPPMFFAHAFDDSCQNSLLMALALKRAGVPTELHIFQDGGHGFGVRNSGHPTADWKQDFERWLRANGFLDPLWIRHYTRDLDRAMAAGSDIPRIDRDQREVTLEDAFVAQKRLVKRRRATDQIAGFKGGAITEQAQLSLGLEHPLSGVLFHSGKIAATSDLQINVAKDKPSVIETEIGFVVGVDIGYEVLDAEQARNAVEKVVPVIELPLSLAHRVNSPLTTAETIALNVGSDRFIVGAPKSPRDINLAALPIQLYRDGIELHSADSSMVKGSHWENLKTLMNQCVSQGYTIPAGSVIISGALGKIHEAKPANYSAKFGDLGEINFRLTASE